MVKGSGAGADPLQEPEEVRLTPSLDALAVFEAQNRNARRDDLLAGGRDSLKGPQVFYAHGEPGHDLVAVDEHVIEHELRRGKRRHERFVESTDTWKSGLDSGVSVKHEVGAVE
jgi:hypothetical protein